MKNLFSTITILFVVMLLSGNIFAQQWSAEQQDVWAGVQKYWDAEAKGDVQGFLSYFDDSYMGWSNQSRVPQSKANTSKWIENGIKDNSTVVYTITPLTIWVKGDFAYVHYTYAELTQDKMSGEKKNNAGTWTDILMKKNGKWVMIGDHGGRTSGN